MDLSTFRTAPCPHCDRPVLTARDLVDEDLRDRCVHCDHLFDPEEISWAAPDEVLAMGYFIEGFDSQPSSERGCKGGTCGVRQPAN